MRLDALFEVAVPLHAPPDARVHALEGLELQRTRFDLGQLVAEVVERTWGPVRCL